MRSKRRSPLHAALPQILSDRRAAAELTQVQLAERLGRPQSFVSKIEHGERRLELVELFEVAEALGCLPEDIVAQLRTSIADVAPKRVRRKTMPQPE